MPSETNPAAGRTATVSINRMSFLRSVMVGDEGSIFTGIERVGRTSLTSRAEAWRRDDSEGLPTVGDLPAEASDGEEGGAEHDAGWSARAAKTIW